MASFQRIQGEIASAPRHMLSRYIFEGDDQYSDNSLQEGHYILSYNNKSSSRILVKALKYGQNQLLVTPIEIFNGSQSSGANIPTETQSPTVSPHLASIRPDSSLNMPTKHLKRGQGKKRPINDANPDPELSSNKRPSTVPSTTRSEIAPKNSSEAADALDQNRIDLLDSLENDWPQHIKKFIENFLGVDILGDPVQIIVKTYDEFWADAVKVFEQNRFELDAIHINEATYAPIFHNAFLFSKSGVLRIYEKCFLLDKKVDIDKMITVANDKPYEIVHYRLFPFHEMLAAAKPGVIMGVHKTWVKKIIHEQVKDADLGGEVINIVSTYCEICNADLYFPWFIGECKAKETIDVAIMQLRNSLAAAAAASVEWIGEGEEIMIFGAAYDKNLIKLFVSWVEPIDPTTLKGSPCKWSFKMKLIGTFLLDRDGMKRFFKRLIQIHRWGVTTRMDKLKNKFKAGIRKYIQEREYRKNPRTSGEPPCSSFYHAPPPTLSQSQGATPSVSASPPPTASASRTSTRSGRGLRNIPNVNYKY